MMPNHDITVPTISNDIYSHITIMTYISYILPSPILQVCSKRHFEKEHAWAFSHFSASSVPSHHMKKDLDIIFPDQIKRHCATKPLISITKLGEYMRFFIGERREQLLTQLCKTKERQIIQWNCPYTAVNRPRHALNQSIKGVEGVEGREPHIPPYHHPPSLHAAQPHMLLSHSPTATSSENHAPSAYHRRGNTWRRKEDMDTHMAAK